jgi:hypothetical protein
MIFGDEYCVGISPNIDLDQMSEASLEELFQAATPISLFESAEDHSFFQNLRDFGFEGLLCYRIDKDRAIEIDDAVIRAPIAIRNRVSDLISFQFVSTVKRSEFFGKRKHVHDLGPALIVSAIPREETTCRVPRTNVPIRHVVVHTTLSSLLEPWENRAMRIPSG